MFFIENNSFKRGEKKSVLPPLPVNLFPVNSGFGMTAQQIALDLAGESFRH